MRRLLLLLALAAAPARADPLTIIKTVTIVSDPVGNAVPRSVPGAVADYRTTATNPVANVAKPVRNLVLAETLPADVVLRVTDLAGAGKGPVEFADGLPPSGLTYAYSAATPTTDGLEFSNGTTWAYQPVPDADGYDANVRAIRITLGSTFATATSFQLRYRTRIR
jgi:hypothetical protein